ncbi:MAG: sigma 54-interacting transcriptional regulator [Deltaproteobacteria bacterium]|nr:sigma 54-interacting transcriptional regulator [Deltaproteobacteria bacterium]
MGTRPSSIVFVPDGVVTLGRRLTCGAFAVDIDDERVSREHATVRWQRDGWRIVDLGSRNGTFVDGERLKGERHVEADAIVRLGHTVLVLLRDGRGHGATKAARGELAIGPGVARADDEIRRAAGGRTLLLQGEAGVGKERSARLFHDARRPDGPFVAVDCAAIPEGAAERLLFGSRRGAFSGATDAVGHLQSADGGTLFLDEIAELDLGVQAKLLRVLETREVLPIGATSPIAIDLGVVAATHVDLRAVPRTHFREDLYDRLAHAVVRIPPLRERKVDAARLAVAELASIDGRLSAHAKLVEACCVRAWPGNVRELRTAVARAARTALADHRLVVRAADLPEHAGAARDDPPGVVAPEPPPIDLGPPLEQARLQHRRELDESDVRAVMAEHGDNLTAAARAAGIDRSTLDRLLRRFGIRT